MATNGLIPLRRAVAIGMLTAASSRSVLAASSFWVALLGVMYQSDAGPALPAMVVTAVALFPVAAWAGTAQLAATSRDLRSLLTAACGPRRVLLADAAPLLLWVLAAAVVGVLAVAFFDPHPASTRTLLFGFLLHVLCGCSGGVLAIGAHARQATRGATALLGAAALIATLTVPMVPPGGPIYRAWGDPDRSLDLAGRSWALLGPTILTAAGIALSLHWRKRRL